MSSMVICPCLKTRLEIPDRLAGVDSGMTSACDVCGIRFLTDYSHLNIKKTAEAQALARRIEIPGFRLMGYLTPIPHGFLYFGYRAEDGRPVAISVYPTEEEPRRAQFAREVHILRQLRHPNIMPLTDAGEGAGFLYKIQPFMPGRTLKSVVIEKTVLQPFEVGEIMGPVAHALEYLHTNGFLHRHIRPASILLALTGEVLLVDFSAASAEQGQVALEDEDLLEDFHPYAAPEILEAWFATGYSDQYSLAAVTYHIACGRPPVPGAPPANELVSDFPEIASRALAKALQPDFASRFSSMRDFGRRAFRPLLELAPQHEASRQIITRLATRAEFPAA